MPYAHRKGTVGQQKLRPFLRGPTLTVLYAYGISERKQSCGPHFLSCTRHSGKYLGVAEGRQAASTQEGPQEYPKRKSPTELTASRAFGDDQAQIDRSQHQ